MQSAVPEAGDQAPETEAEGVTLRAVGAVFALVGLPSLAVVAILASEAQLADAVERESAAVVASSALAVVPAEAVVTVEAVPMATDATAGEPSPEQAPAASGVEASTNAPIVQAVNVDLGEPLEQPLVAPAVPEPAPTIAVNSSVPPLANVSAEPAAALDNESEAAVGGEPAFVMLGAEVPPATATRLSWSPSQSFEGIAAPTPVLVVNGASQGPVLCLTAAVHGDELNGIEIVRRVLYNLDPDKLSGTLVGVPIVNLQGFRRGSRYLPDRRDLNRFFPGDPAGSSAARIAFSFFNEVIRHCDALVDLHTGSFYRTNLPQLRANLRNPDVLELTQGFDATVVLHSDGAVGTLRQAAVAAGIPAVTLEAGEPMRLQEREVAHGVNSVRSLLSKLGMVKKAFFWGDPEPVYYQSIWVRTDQGGILFSEVTLGQRVRKRDLLGAVTDPITNVRTEIFAPYDGRVLGMAVDQVVMPGFAAYRIGMQSSEDEVLQPPVKSADGSSALHMSQADQSQPAELPPGDAAAAQAQVDSE